MAALAEGVGTSASSLLREHVLHVFPSFGIGGVPLRMVRIINHFGKRFRHTVIALDDDFAAAAGLDRDLDVSLSRDHLQNAAALHAVLDSALVLRRLRPDLLMTYNWGAIEWAMANPLSPVARHVPFEAGVRKPEAESPLRPRGVLLPWAPSPCAPA